MVGQTLSHYRVVRKIGGGGPAFARGAKQRELRRGLAEAERERRGQ